MPHPHEAGSLRSALQFVMSSDMPSEHRAVLIELLTRALRDHDVHHDQAAAQKLSRPWEDADTRTLRSLLNGQTATSWQHADELLTRAAKTLDRDPHYLRTKASDLGLGESVDYRLAKARAAERARAED